MAEGNAIDLMERATALFRAALGADAWIYYLGAAPFAAAAVWIWNRLAGLAATPAELAGWALLLTLLYAIKTITDGIFLRRLIGAPPAVPRSPLAALDRAAQEVTARVGLIVLWLVLLPVAIGVVPIYLAAQFLPLVAGDLDAPVSLRGRLRRAFALAFRHYGSATLLTVIAWFAALVLAADLAALAWGLPALARAFTGSQAAFFRASSFIGNSTLLAGIGGALYLLFDPWWKAVAAIAYFRSVSAVTGADLVAQLAALAPAPPPAEVA